MINAWGSADIRLMPGEREVLRRLAERLPTTLSRKLLHDAIVGKSLSSDFYFKMWVPLTRLVVSEIEARNSAAVVGRARTAHDRGCSIARCAAILSCTETEARVYFEKSARQTPARPAVEEQESCES